MKESPHTAECTPGTPLQAAAAGGSKRRQAEGQQAGRAEGQGGRGAWLPCGARHPQLAPAPPHTAPEVPQRQAVVAVINEVDHGSQRQGQADQGKDDAVGARPNQLLACSRGGAGWRCRCEGAGAGRGAGRCSAEQAALGAIPSKQIQHHQNQPEGTQA
jgi:hypothetical protein